MAITLPKMVPLGGGAVRYEGSYSHSAGAAHETFLLGGGGRVSSIQLLNMDAGGRLEPIAVTESVSGSTNTVTVRGSVAVTDGRLSVVVDYGK